MSKKGWHKFIQGIGWVFPAYHATTDGIKDADHGQGWIDHATGASDAEREGRIHYDYGGLTPEQYAAWLKYKQQTPEEQHNEALEDVRKHDAERAERGWHKEHPNPTVQEWQEHMLALAAEEYYREHPEELQKLAEAMNELVKDQAMDG